MTLRLYDNYGGILQNYALCRCLAEMGHSVESFDLQRPMSVRRTLRDAVRRKSGAERAAERAIGGFIRRNIPQTGYKIRFPFQLGVDPRVQAYDAYIVGSDQVWRRPFMEYGLKNMFLGFVGGEDKIRLSYGASFGLDNVGEYSADDVRTATECLSRFNGVSVREDTGVGICRNVFGRDAIQVLDPTLLLPTACYGELAGQGTRSNEGDLLAYLLDMTDMKKQVLVETVACGKYTPFSYNTLCRGAASPSVQQWLKGYKDARFVVTDSFHGCVFSIIFNKPFIVIGNEGRGLSRFSSLLSLLGLENRLLNSFDTEAVRRLVQADIDWTDVNNRLAVLREKSISFLKEGLS